jgi:DUF177 domain-containing protein
MTLPPIDVTDLMGRPGASRIHALHGTLEGLGTEVAVVPEDAPIEGDLLLESVVEGVLVTGRLSGTRHLVCARCLKEFDEPFAVSLAEMFIPEPEEEGDEYPMDPAGFLDPEQMVRDAVGVELPFSPLCKPDCLGLCPVCGGDRNLGQDEGGCEGEHAVPDPRWAELETLLEQMENQGN